MRFHTCVHACIQCCACHFQLWVPKNWFVFCFSCFEVLPRDAHSPEWLHAITLFTAACTSIFARCTSDWKIYYCKFLTPFFWWLCNRRVCLWMFTWHATLLVWPRMPGPYSPTKSFIFIIIFCLSPFDRTWLRSHCTADFTEIGHLQE